MEAAYVTRLQALADNTRNRLLLVLERQELTVSEVCDVLQLPQSTVSRHLRILADDGWVASRADGASRYYRMSGHLEPAARKLWQLVKEQMNGGATTARDAQRLRGVLAERRARSDDFFASAAGQWDHLRADLFGSRTELLPLLGLLDPAWTVGDLGCGTGQLTEALAPFVGRVIAVDGSAAMLRAARARVGELSNVEIRRGDLESLPIEDAGVDLACMVLVFPYLAEPARALAEAARILRPGGRVLITDLRPHEQAEYRQALGHQWLGVSEDQLGTWMAAAGLTMVRYRPVPLDADARGPTLFTAIGIPVRPAHS
jgi:ArsR family transcriptional regulator